MLRSRCVHGLFAYPAGSSLHHSQHTSRPLVVMALIQQSLLCSLPLEVLLFVRSHIHTLADHVHFSMTCRATYRLYDMDFWHFACATSGWGIRQLSVDNFSSLAGMSDSAREARLWPWAGLARIVVYDAHKFTRDIPISGLHYKESR